jgi:hypothetical protein
MTPAIPQVVGGGKAAPPGRIRRNRATSLRDVDGVQQGRLVRRAQASDVRRLTIKVVKHSAQHQHDA